MGSILVVTLMLSGPPHTTPQRLETTMPNCAWEKRVIMGMNKAEAEAGTPTRYMPFCSGKL
jgi:hypothetical protein